ncbi:MAG: hypothetical protein M3N98_14050 [Actinomycetota bacterium]|nr:hypothetical protein [Actinomycetota bacterium]
MSSIAGVGSAAFAAKGPPPPSNSQLGVLASSFHFTVFGNLPGGPAKVQLINMSSVDPHEFLAVNLGPVCSKFTQADATHELDKLTKIHGNPLPTFLHDCPGGAFEGANGTGPLSTSSATYNFTPGRTLYWCAIRKNGTPHYKQGMLGFLNTPGPVLNP